MEAGFGLVDQTLDFQYGCRKIAVFELCEELPFADTIAPVYIKLLYGSADFGSHNRLV